MSHPVLTLTVMAAAALLACRGVTAAGAVPSAGAAVCGFTRSSAATGEAVAVDCLGQVEAETGAAVAAGALLEVDSSGRVITKNTGIAVARMAPGQAAAAAAGERVQVMFIPN